MFHRSKGLVLVSLVTASMALLPPRILLAHGGASGGGHGGGPAGGHSIGGHGAGADSIGAHGGSAVHGMGGAHPGGFGRDSYVHGYARGFMNDRGTGGSGVSGYGVPGNGVLGYGRAGSRLNRHTVAAPSGHWKRFDSANAFSKANRLERLGPFCRECFFIVFGGNWRWWELYNSTTSSSDEPWWYADVANGDYQNPYYVTPDIYGGYNYAFPLPQSVQGPQDDVRFADARQEFYSGYYVQALVDTDRALREMPHNPDVHAFYALVAFALADYNRAAAVAHTLLEAGPGWDRATLQSCYPCPDVYTTHLQALEQYVDAHQADPAPRFLLAYQYLMLGHRTAASQQLAQVVALQPHDTLAAAVLAAIRRGSDDTVAIRRGSDAPAAIKRGSDTFALKGGSDTSAAKRGSEYRFATTTAQAPSGTTTPNAAGPTVALEHLSGTWQATPEPGVTIEATLGPDDHFVWTATERGQTRSFSGTYALDHNRLVFTRADGIRMQGLLTSTGSEAFQVRLTDTAPRNRELQFWK